MISGTHEGQDQQPPGYRPRRAPSPPRITEQDKPSDAELARIREQLAGKPKCRAKGRW